MEIPDEQKIIINEITNFIKTSTDTDNLALSAFIARLQVGRNQDSLQMRSTKSDN